MSEIEMVAGRRSREPYTDLPDWVRLSGVSNEAAALYWAMKMHVFVLRGDNTVRTKADNLAALCGYSRGDKVTGFRRELEAIGAVETRRVGMPARLVYVIHDVPADDYAGPRSLADWYKIHRQVMKIKDQVSPVPPVSGEQDEPLLDGGEKPQVSTVAPERGEQGLLPPNEGPSVTPEWGGHVQEVSSVQEVEPLPPTPRDHEPAADARGEAVTGGGGNPSETIGSRALDACVTEIHKLVPAWAPGGVRAALERAHAEGRDPATAFRALRLIAESWYGRPGYSPNRLNGDGPWWADAVERKPAPRPRAQEPRCASHGRPASWCCGAGGVAVEDPPLARDVALARARETAEAAVGRRPKRAAEPLAGEALARLADAVAAVTGALPAPIWEPAPDTLVESGTDG